MYSRRDATIYSYICMRCAMCEAYTMRASQYEYCITSINISYMEILKKKKQCLYVCSCGQCVLCERWPYIPYLRCLTVHWRKYSFGFFNTVRWLFCLYFCLFYFTRSDCRWFSATYAHIKHNRKFYMYIKQQQQNAKKLVWKKTKLNIFLVRFFFIRSSFPSSLNTIPKTTAKNWHTTMWSSKIVNETKAT